MEDKIDITIAYYTKKGQDIIDTVNSSDNLTADQIIQYGEEMAIIEYKLTALEVAKEN
ncbi:hypothetical protein HNV10_02360 [Winogradskyella litoriviva]|uniref:Phage protein n=1 Tax=Winogradskyella litoriviva TaxID=1220182 RepID=A0ABX2E0R1_9FLAO|nr:hypothetical protein [Winogradskyella litoriviva]NRD22066.1 hypothetical protein [Winogradskyella litoriviva]